MANFTFSNDYLEEQTSTDLDGNGVIGDGTNGNSSAPNVGTYTNGDNYIVAGSLANVAALNAVKAFFSTFNTNQSISWGNNSSYKYNNVAGTAANLSGLSNTDLGNITGTLTISDSHNSPALLSVLQSIKSKASNATFTYSGVKGTTKDLADTRSSSYDWITNITAVGGKKYATFTDLCASPSHLSTLANGLDANDYIFKIGGLTYSTNPFIGTVNGPSLVYRSDISPDTSTSYAEGAQSYVSGDYTVTAMGFLNKVPEEGDMPFSDFNISGDDVASNVELTIHFYGGEQLSHVNISGATVSTSTGYQYSQTAGSGTSSVADDIWTLKLKLDAGQPAKTTAVSNNTGAKVIGVMINSVSASKVGGNSDYGGSVFRTNAFWEDIDLMSSEFKFSDLSPGFEINGTNGEEVDFDFYFTKAYLERTFNTDFDAIAGGFAGTALSSVNADNDHTGTYIDVSKAGSISELRLPVTITDVSATTAGNATDFYKVEFTNDSWSEANLSMVYGPSINSAPSSGGSNSTTKTIENTIIKGRRYWNNTRDSLTGQANINLGLLGGDDYLEVIGGIDNFANGNNGADHIILRGGKGRYLGGADNDKIEVFHSSLGSLVNGNKGVDSIIGSAGGMTYRGGPDNDIFTVSAGNVWGDKDADTFQATAGAEFATVHDYTVGLDRIQGVAGGTFTLTDRGLLYSVGSDQMLLLLGITDASQVTMI